MSLTTKVKGGKMVLRGIGGIILNEVVGAISGEVQTTYEMNKLPKQYISNGIKYLFKNKNLNGVN